jgi:hypothetical protein
LQALKPPSRSGDNGAADSERHLAECNKRARDIAACLALQRGSPLELLRNPQGRASTPLDATTAESEAMR